MANIIRISILLAFVFSTSIADAKWRWQVPENDEVMIEINSERSELVTRNTLNPNEIDIFVWNMYKGDKPDWQRDYKNLTPSYDILILQELWLDHRMLQTFYEDETFSYHMATSFIDRKRSDTPTGVGTASKVEPIRTFWQRSKYREPFIRTPKMVLFTEYALEGTSKTLLTGNIHAINFVSSRKLRHQLKNMAKVFAAHDGPAVMAGDFNTWSKKKMKYLHEFARDSGMTEVKFDNGHQRMKTFGKYLDYIFVKGADVYDSHVFGNIDGSDHKPMTVKISVDTSN